MANYVMLKGRLAGDPRITSTQDGMTIARYSLACDRFSEGVDFVPCVAFGRTAEFAEKYLAKGKEVLVEGRIQTGSYTNNENQKVYTFDVVVNRHEFCGSKNDAQQTTPTAAPSNDFMSIPEGIDEELPFH